MDTFVKLPNIARATCSEAKVLGALYQLGEVVGQNHILTEPSLITIEAEDKQANS
jgi:hypothetical protein